MTTSASVRDAILQSARQARRWGWPGAIAVALLAAGAAVALVVVPRFEDRLIETRAAADAAERLARRSRGAGQNAAALADPVGTWRAALPEGAGRQRRIATLLALAEANGLVPQRTEFRFSTDSALGVARYRVTLPVTGRYSAVRSFVDGALAADPALLLDSVRLSRSSAQVSAVQAELGFSLLMRNDAADPLQPTPVASLARPGSP